MFPGGKRSYLSTRLVAHPTLSCSPVMRVNKSSICGTTWRAGTRLGSDSPEMLADMKVRRLQLMGVNYGNKVWRPLGLDAATLSVVTLKIWEVNAF